MNADTIRMEDGKPGSEEFSEISTSTSALTVSKIQQKSQKRKEKYISNNFL